MGQTGAVFLLGGNPAFEPDAILRTPNLGDSRSKTILCHITNSRSALRVVLGSASASAVAISALTRRRFGLPRKRNRLLSLAAEERVGHRIAAQHSFGSCNDCESPRAVDRLPVFFSVGHSENS